MRSLQAADAKQMTFINLDGVPKSVDSALVKRVYVTNPLKGVGQGFAIGALLGAVGGFVAAVADPGDGRYVSQDLVVLIKTVACAVLGAVVGAGIGAASGGATVFEFEEGR